MKTYNERIAELNNEKDKIIVAMNGINYKDFPIKIDEINTLTFELYGTRIKAEQLNELRAEKIEEVKELTESLDNIKDSNDNIAISFLEGKIDYLKAQWNITESELK